MNQNNTPLIKTLRRLVKDSGYNFTDSFNDRMKDGSRRFKFMDKRKSAQYDADERVEIDEFIRSGLDCDYIQAGWIVCKEGTPEQYTAYAIVV